MADGLVSARRVLPMQAAGTQHFIERTYRESAPFQWVRETLVNALEANATTVEFGIEWQGVENQNVHRRLIADDGCGMTAEELVEFFNTFGGGGKPIGGAHENFGVGSKTSLLPWNTYGVVVVSWVEGDASMIWVQLDSSSGEYGLRLEETEDDDGNVTLEAVYEPYNDADSGVNWAAVRPDWMGDSGTVIVLMGDDPSDDTVLGDPSRDEDDIKGISSYLNRRMWELSKNVEVRVDELRTNDSSKWPTSLSLAHGPAKKGSVDRRTNTRTIQGAKHYITYPQKSFTAGKLASKGRVELSDGTEIDWYLWDGERPAVQSYASIGGFIASEYKDELYDVVSHHSTYRTFGVAESAVRQRLWLIARPPHLDGDGKHGVYPTTDRNSLLLKGGPNAGGRLPFNEWGAEFADVMPTALIDAIKSARAGRSGSVEDDAWRNRLADRFGSRWRIPKLRARKGGKATTNATQPGAEPKRVKKASSKRRSGTSAGGKSGTVGKQNTGSQGGDKPASKSSMAGGIPTYRTVLSEDVSPGMIAAWQPNDPEHPEGVVLLNVEHPILTAEIEHWQSQYPDHLSDDIAEDVIAVYGEMAVAKVAHSEHLKGIVPSKVVEDEFRSEASLSMALLGLIGEEAVLAPRIGGKYRKRKAD